MSMLLQIVAGAALAAGLIFVARRSGDRRREKTVYAAALIVAALIYVGFGAFSGSLAWQLTEIAGVALYAAFAVFGVRRSGWFLAAGWALHMIWDVAVHGASAGFVPHWYQMLCVGFDLLLAAYIAAQEGKGK